MALVHTGGFFSLVGATGRAMIIGASRGFPDVCEAWLTHFLPTQCHQFSMVAKTAIPALGTRGRGGQELTPAAAVCSNLRLAWAI